MYKLISLYILIEYKRSESEKVYGWIRYPSYPSHMGNHEKADVLLISF